MADDVDVGIGYRPQHAFCILLERSRTVTKRMDACNAQVELLHVRFIQVEPSFRIEDVDFRPQQQLNPIHTSGHDMQVTEINQVTSTRDAGRMLGDAQQFQSLVGRGLRHLLQACAISCSVLKACPLANVCVCTSNAIFIFIS